MSIYIKGMEMPPNCFLCHLSYLRGERLFCYLTKEEVVRAKKAVDCPLISVPEHGRLIDGDVAEVISYTDESGDFADGVLYAADWIAAQPTIIPADKEERDG